MTLVFQKNDGLVCGFQRELLVLGAICDFFCILGIHDKTKYKRIGVIGPNAAEVHLGGYSNNPGRGVSILQGSKTN